jgi:hypothetical protein
VYKVTVDGKMATMMPDELLDLVDLLVKCHDERDGSDQGQL